MILQLIPSAIGAPILEVRLEDLPFRIGRSVDATLTIDDRWVSRYHCEITQDHDELFVRDLDSRHGTFVNGERIELRRFSAGDHLGIGLTTFATAIVPEPIDATA